MFLRPRLDEWLEKVLSIFKRCFEMNAFNYPQASNNEERTMWRIAEGYYDINIEDKKNKF